MNALDAPYIRNNYARGPGDSLFPYLWTGLRAFYMASAIPTGLQGQTVRPGPTANGNVLDLSLKASQRYDGTAQTGMDLVPGVDGVAFSCPGTGSGSQGKIDTNMTLANVGASANAEFTFMAWIKSDPAQATASVSFSYQGLGIFGDTAGYFWLTRCSIPGTGDMIYYGNYDGSTKQAGVSYTAGQWMHVACVHTGGSIYIYKGGVLGGSTTSGNTQVTSNLITIGFAYTTSGSRWQGLIDDVRFYDRALTLAEIAQSAAGATPLIKNRPVRFYEGKSVISTGHPTMRRWAGSIQPMGAGRIGRSW